MNLQALINDQLEQVKHSEEIRAHYEELCRLSDQRTAISEALSFGYKSGLETGIRLMLKRISEGNLS